MRRAITDKVKRKVGTSLLVNYLYYPDLEIDPIKLYASIGLGGYIRILPSFGLGEDTNAVIALLIIIQIS